MLEVATRLDGSITLLENSKEYVVIPTGTNYSELARMLKKLIALSYDIIGDSGEILSIVRHSPFANRVHITKNGEEIVLDLPHLKDRDFYYNGKKYKLRTKKLTGEICIERDGRPMAWGKYSVSRVRFMRYEREIGDIIKEIAVGIGINLSGVQIFILGFLAGAA
ncbi:MAG: hypothetical protein ACE5IJ_08630 [Thermoplasmata archaeon]